MGPSDVARLARARELLAERGYDTTDTELVCYSGAGFTGDLATSPETPIPWESPTSTGEISDPFDAWAGSNEIMKLIISRDLGL